MELINESINNVNFIDGCYHFELRNSKAAPRPLWIG
jgi:hypothetical protein